MSAVLLEVTVTVSVWVSLAAPEVIPERFTICSPAFSLMVRLASELRVGGWFTGLTVTVKAWVTMLLLVPPSLTLTVIVAVPKALAAGLNESEPVEFGVTYETVGLGTSAVMLEVAVTVSVWFSLAAPELITERFTVCKPAF